LVEYMLNYWKRVVVWDLYPKGYDYHIKWLMNKLASHPLVKITDERIKTVKRYMRLSLKKITFMCMINGLKYYHTGKV